MLKSLKFDHAGLAEMASPFRHLSDHAELGVTMSVSAGRTIVIEGDPLDHYFRILSGSVRLYKSVVDGRRQIIDFLGPNECFGLIGLSSHASSVEAISNVLMIRYSRRHIDGVVEGEPAFSNQLFRLACSELDRAQRRMLLLGRLRADERLAFFLTDLARRQETISVRLAMSRQDIADHLGLTIETVSRLFSRFKRSGLIDLPNRHTVVLRDDIELAGLAEGRFT